MKRFLAITFLWFPLLCFTYSASAETFTCLACHSAMKGKIKTEKGALVDVNVDGDRYAASVHGGFDCIMCHKQVGSNPHEPAKLVDIPRNVAELASKISHKAKVDPVALAACVECHDGVYKAIEESIHGKRDRKKESDGALCLDCHGSPHYITKKNNLASPVSRINIVKTCGECHEKEELAKKYNFSTQIMERYDESFHGKNIYWDIKTRLPALTAIIFTT